MFIDPKFIINHTFTVNDPTIQYICVGYDYCGTPIVFGALYDSTNNRSQVKSFKITDVTFFGNITKPA